MDNARIHELELKLRRAVEMDVARHAYEAYAAGLPWHLIMYQVDAAVDAVKRRMREWGPAASGSS